MKGGGTYTPIAVAGKHRRTDVSAAPTRAAPVLACRAMEAATSSRAVERYAPWIAGALVALAVALPRMPPAADLPQFEMIAAALRDVGDPRRFPSSVYVRSMGSANQLFFLLAWPLSYLIAVDVLVRGLFALVLGLLPVLTARAARHLGVSPLVGVVVAPLALGFGFRWALVAYLVGVTLLLAAVPDLEQLARAPTPRRALRGVAWGVLIGLAHGSSAVFLATLLGALALCARPPWRRLPWVAAPAVAALAAFALGFVQWQQRLTPATATVGHRDVAFTARPALVAYAVWGPLASPWSYALPALFALGVVALGLGRWGRAPRAPASRAMLLTAAALAAQFFLWPSELGGAGLVFHRFAMPAAVFLALGLAGGGGAGVGRALASALGLAAMLAALHPLIASVDRAYRDLDRIIARVAVGAAVVELDLVEPPYVMSVYTHAHGRVVALRGGRSQDSFALLPQFMVRLRPECAWLETRERLRWPENLVPAVDLTRFRYVLVRHARRHDPALIDRALAPEARLVAREGRWSLYETTRPLRPLDEPDRPTSDVHGETLGQRVRALGGVDVFPRLPGS